MFPIPIQTAHNPDYEDIGGKTRIRLLVERFYHHMDALPEVRSVRAMHPADLSGSREKLYEFMSGWLGGPPLFVQKRGSPCITKAHRPFHIDETAAQQWMKCMRQAMVDVGIDANYRQMLEPAFERVAQALRSD